MLKRISSQQIPSSGILASLDVKSDPDASLEMVKSFGDYGTVIIHTHGWYWMDILPEAWKRPGFRTGTVVDWDQMFSHLSDLINFRIAISKGALETNDDGDEGYHFVVFPSFIEKYVGSLPGTFFYLGYCHSLQNDKMWDVLKNKGAKVAFGFSDEVQTEHDVAMFAALMQDAMLPNEDSERNRPLTAQEAYNNIPEPDKVDTGHKNARFEMRTDGAEGENFIFLENHYLTITAGDYILVWDVNSNSMATDVEHNDGSIAHFPVPKASISNWLSQRTEISSQPLYSMNPWGRNEKIFNQELTCWDDVDPSVEFYNPGATGDSCTIRAADGSEAWYNFLESYTWYYFGTGTSRARSSDFSFGYNWSIPYWYKYGVKLGSKKISTNNIDTEDRYFQVAKTRHDNLSGRQLDPEYGFCLVGSPPDFFNRLISDTFNLNDPFGFNQEITLNSTYYAYVESNKSSCREPMLEEVRKNEIDGSYNLAGIYTDKLIAQVRAIKISTSALYCYKDANNFGTNVLWAEIYSLNFCEPELVSVESQPIDIFATVGEFDDTVNVDPFTLSKNGQLETEIAKLLDKSKSDQVSLKFLK
ncbi:MAG: hypothetical protein KKC76_17215 [Proteobacteria bacterium]|nr:hypothetical protein [Pseudomonadota bacterium]MBU4295876.1 hypothetical protein [Pseudomonadota bacterium]MCG2748397.1 hypothetical protein [Desulfobulbaceae bacterium]